MKVFYFILIIVLVFFASCKNTGTQNVRMISISGQSLSLDTTTVYLGYPSKIMISNSLLFILDNQSPHGYFINVYSYPDLRYIISVGAHGEGPEELLGVGCFDIDKDFLYLFDISKVRLFKYSIKDLTHGINTPSAMINYPGKLMPVLSFAKTPDGFVFLQFTSDGGQFIQANDSGEVTGEKVKMPFYDRQYKALSDPRYIPSLWQSILDFDNKNELAVAVTQLGEVLEIYDIKKDTINVKVGKGDLPGLFKTANGFGIGKINGFLDVKISDSKIYTVYSGVGREEMIKSHQQASTIPQGANHIIVFNKKGEIIHKYQLDRYITSIDVNSKDNTIVAIDPNDEINPICLFNLP